MPSSNDTEITLGTGKLVGLFFGLVIVCAAFFALGYSLGRKSDALAVAASSAPLNPAGGKPGAAANPKSPAASAESAFRADHPDQPAAGVASSPPSTTTGDTSATPLASTPSATDASAPAASGNYTVQVAAVSHQEDADALADALRKKQYSAVVTAGAGADKLFHVQVGPFAEMKDAEAMKARLTSDGYNPIVKK